MSIAALVSCSSEPSMTRFLRKVARKCVGRVVGVLARLRHDLAESTSYLSIEAEPRPPHLQRRATQSKCRYP